MCGIELWKAWKFACDGNTVKRSGNVWWQLQTGSGVPGVALAFLGIFQLPAKFQNRFYDIPWLKDRKVNTALPPTLWESVGG